MPTFIYTRDKLIEYLKTKVGPNEVIVLSNERTGKIFKSPGTGMQVSQSFSPEVFRDQNYAHITSQKSRAIGMIITEKKRLTDKAVKAIVDVDGPKQMTMELPDIGEESR